METNGKKGDSPATIEEERKLRAFRLLTDMTMQRLSVQRMNLAEAWGIAAELRNTATRIFPGKAHVFDLVIAPRMERVIKERFRL